MPRRSSIRVRRINVAAGVLYFADVVDRPQWKAPKP